ncbi:hypothetical protein [Paenibacillus sp. RUD330]|uniref:hypothetical protein n=1 Tax=Paenibacillus sp. RUD330 TaxID=2023772 RepID=UPI0012FD0BC0|nr:hypothetical protein [Paenibacillus sp. RUD330]QID16124.1 hypothetical protein CIC07_25725 [Paenibacillus sp. RUD330]
MNVFIHIFTGGGKRTNPEPWLASDRLPFFDREGLSDIVEIPLNLGKKAAPEGSLGGRCGFI